MCNAIRIIAIFTRTRLLPGCVLFSLLLAMPVMGDVLTVRTPSHGASSLFFASLAVSEPSQIKVVQDREIIALILGFTVAVIVYVNRQALMTLPAARWWIAAFLTRLLAWNATVAETFIWPDGLDVVEHLLLMMSTGLTAVASWKSFGEFGERRSAST